ncbi:MAG: hypothetical protein R6X12_04670 [bacterium]
MMSTQTLTLLLALAIPSTTLPGRAHRAGTGLDPDKPPQTPGVTRVAADVRRDTGCSYSPTWETRAPLPRARAHHMVTAYPADSSSLCLVFGGTRTAFGSMDQTSLAYDPGADEWTELAPLPRRRGIGRAIALGGLVYVLGGCVEFGTGLPAVDTYNPAANEWTLAPALPDSLHDFAAAAWRDSLLYVFGGGNWAPSSPPTDRAWLFDPGAGTWLPASPLPAPLGATSLAVIGDDLYLATGWTSDGPTNRAWHGSINPDNPAEIAWQEIDTIPARRRCRTVGAVERGRPQFIGGVTAGGTVSSEVWELEPATNRWTRRADKPTPVSDVFGAAELLDWVIVPGGYAGALPYRSENEARYRARFSSDVALRTIVAPRDRLAAGTPSSATIAIHNYGTSTELFPAGLRVRDSTGGQQIFVAESLVTLAAGTGREITLGQFVPGPNRVYSVLAWTGLRPDSNRTNDTARARCRTTPLSEPDGFGYRWESTQEPDTVRFHWASPADADTLAGWFPDRDDGWVVRALPFPFPFYGDTLTALAVSVDGFLSLSGLVAPTNRSLPAFDLDGLIAPLWHDLTLRNRGAVLENRHAEAYRLTWSGVPRYGLPEETADFAVTLAAGGTIRFDYLETAGEAGSTVGIQGGDGGNSWFIEYCCNGEPARRRPADSVSILIHPPRTIALEEPEPALAGLAGRLPGIIRGRFLLLPAQTASPVPLVATIYDAAGRRRARCALPPGATGIALADDSGRPLPAGAWFLVLADPSRSLLLLTHRFILASR